MQRKELIPLLDLTLLEEQAGQSDIQQLAQRADDYQVAAICVYPKHLGFIPAHIHIPKATVVNFPSGEESLKEVLQQIKHAVHEHGVQEIDYVFPYQQYIAGKTSNALAHLEACYRLCQDHQIRFKVILETGAFPSLGKIVQASQDILQVGADFLKTSTGKLIPGATLPAAVAILTAIKDSHQPCGLKVSGGIKTYAQAKDYGELATFMLHKPLHKNWFRLGSSSLLTDLISEQSTLVHHNAH